MVESIRERLERLKNAPPKVTLPLSDQERSTPTERKPMITPESVYMRKVEKLIANLESMKARMKSDSGQYLSMYYDLKKAEKEFLESIEEPEAKFYDLPDAFLHRVAAIREKIETKKL